VTRTRLKEVVLWTLQLLLAVAFFQAGRFKIGGNPGLARQFREWGYPDHLGLAVGAVEVLGGFALLLRPYAGPAALALMMVMLGALGHHLWRAESEALLPGILLILLGFVVYARWPSIARRKAPPNLSL